MKKQLLFGVALSVCFAAVAQNRTVKPLRTNNTKATQAVKVDKKLMTAQPTDEFSNYYANKNVAQPNRQVKATSVYSEAVIGKTFYDLQTNRSISNRIERYADGTTAATWTFTAQTTGWTDRGAGYNYNDGTDVVTGWAAMPTAKIETERTGFPAIAPFLNGGEVIVSHAAANMLVNKRATKGTGAFTEGAVTPGTSPAATFWPRVATDGDQTIHIFDNTNAVFAGSNFAITYSRSKDGGATWDKTKVILSELDTNNFVGFGGDQYSVDVMGNNVAFVVGDMDMGCVMLKSTDGGDSWTKTDILPFPIPKYNGKDITDIDNDQVADTIESCDGAVHVRLDANGKAHVAFGRMMVIRTDTAGAAGISYFPATDGLMYWNEVTGGTPQVILGVQDLNGDTILNLPQDTSKAMPFGRYFVSMTSHPSIGFDANGRIVIAYSSIMEGTDLNGRAFRHTYVTGSDDGGVTWGDTIIDIVADPFTEGVYGSIAKTVDGYAHVVYQRDFNPGFGVSATAANGGDIDNIGIENEIVYVAVPINDIFIGVDKKSANKPVVNVYPNPANNQVMLSFNGNNANVSISNVIGQQVATYANVASKQALNIASLNKGVYFVSITVNGATATEKLIVE